MSLFDILDKVEEALDKKIANDLEKNMRGLKSDMRKVCDEKADELLSITSKPQSRDEIKAILIKALEHAYKSGVKACSDEYEHYPATDE